LILCSLNLPGSLNLLRGKISFLHNSAEYLRKNLLNCFPHDGHSDTGGKVLQTSMEMVRGTENSIVDMAVYEKRYAPLLEKPALIALLCRADYFYIMENHFSK
jgi:hypothetical protein